MTREERLAKRLEEVYTVAQKELSAEAAHYMEVSANKLDKILDSILKAKTPEEKKSAQDYFKNYAAYANLRDERYIKMLNRCSSVLADANAEALRLINGELPSVYKSSYNAETRSVSAELGIDFALMNDQALRSVLESDENLLPEKSLNRDKDIKWNYRHIHDAVAQAIIQGDSVPELAKRLQSVTEMNRKQANRNARTMINGANNRGRTDAQINLSNQGVNLLKRWSSTWDDRVRDSHAAIDGETVGLDEKFSNGCEYPGDPNGRPEEVYNCRCRLETIIKGFDKAAEYAPAMVAAEVLVASGEGDDIPAGYYPDSIAGVTRSAPMSHEEADNYNVNPLYDKYEGKRGYAINCQTCVPVYEARRRGYDIEALPNTKKNPEISKLSYDYLDIWRDPATGEKPTALYAKGAKTAEEHTEFIDSVVQQGERYSLRIVWKSGGGHVVNLDRDDDGRLRITDNQRGTKEKNVHTGIDAIEAYLSRTMCVENKRYIENVTPEICRIDDKAFNVDIMNAITKERGKK